MADTCTFPECGRAELGRTRLCQGHRKQQREGKELTPIPRKVRGRCSFPDCAGPHSRRGYCEGHIRQLDEGRELRPLFHRNKGEACAGPLCTETARTKGLCGGHYRQQQRGKPLTVFWISKTAPGTLTKAEQQRQRAHRRRARIASAEACEVTIRDWRRLVERYRGLCAYCLLRPWEHQEHVIPLSRGGRHAIGNLLPACGSCNLTKSNRLLSEIRYGGTILRALPPAPKVDSLADATGYLGELAARRG